MAADQMAVTLQGNLALRTEGAVLIQRHLQYHKAPHIPQAPSLPPAPPHIAFAGTRELAHTNLSYCLTCSSLLFAACNPA